MNQIFADNLAVKCHADVAEHTLVELFLGISTDNGFHTRVLLNETNAKELALMLRRVLKERERQLGRAIDLSPKQFERIGVAPEDW